MSKIYDNNGIEIFLKSKPNHKTLFKIHASPEAFRYALNRNGDYLPTKHNLQAMLDRRETINPDDLKELSRQINNVLGYLVKDNASAMEHPAYQTRLSILYFQILAPIKDYRWLPKKSVIENDFAHNICDPVIDILEGAVNRNKDNGIPVYEMDILDCRSMRQAVSLLNKIKDDLYSGLWITRSDITNLQALYEEKGIVELTFAEFTTLFSILARLPETEPADTPPVPDESALFDIHGASVLSLIALPAAVNPDDAAAYDYDALTFTAQQNLKFPYNVWSLRDFLSEQKKPYDPMLCRFLYAVKEGAEYAANAAERDDEQKGYHALSNYISYIMCPN